ncbi:MAG: 30S ribosomal protein S13 [Propionibacteriaceae bacterium]|nr:30S ribosomal protein S13 [Propionibacteriaceae bacterium]
MIPKLTDEQLEEARQAAAAARRQRAELKEKVRRGDLTFATALDQAVDDPILSHIKVVDLLMSIHRIGEKKAADAMRRHGIAPNRRCRGLGHRQLASLKDEFH